jgi:hypothetical protein
MTGEPWRGVNNAVLYSVQFDRVLDGPAVDRIARLLLENTPLRLTPQQAYDALAHALRSDTPLTGDMPQPHGEREFRGFLRDLLGRLDAMRPWPQAPYDRLDAARWADFTGARPIGRLGMGYVQAQERLKKIFDRVEDGGTREVLLLRLRSGAEVALVGAPGAREVTVLQRPIDEPAQPPAQALAELASATGFRPDELTPLP